MRRTHSIGAFAFAAIAVAAGVVSLGMAEAGSLDDGHAAFDRLDYGHAYQLFAEAAANGSPEGLYFKGRMLELGLAVMPNRAEALALYARAASAGHAAALNRLALAAYNGDTEAGQDDHKAFALFTQAADGGDLNALYNLSRMYVEGRGTQQDSTRGFHLMEQAASRDHVLALNTLAARYKQGSASAQRAKARAYFARSAGQGNAVGLYETGLAQMHDGGAAASLRAAHTNFNLAAVRGHPLAAQARRDVAAMMSDEDVLAAQADARAFEAASPGAANSSAAYSSAAPGASIDPADDPPAGLSAN